MTTADEFLMGGGVPSAKFPTVGTVVTGTVAQPPEVRQQTDFTTGEVKYWKDGTPRMQLQVVIQTAERDPANPDDDGLRAVYVKGQMKNAVRDAVRKSGAKGIEVGGTLTVTYTGDGQATQGNPPKNYSASYVPPAAAAASDFLNAPQAAPQGQPAPQAAPVPQQAPQGQAFTQALQNEVGQLGNVATQPAPAGVDPAALAALQNLTPEQKKLLGIG